MIKSSLFAVEIQCVQCSNALVSISINQQTRNHRSSTTCTKIKFFFLFFYLFLLYNVLLIHYNEQLYSFFFVFLRFFFFFTCVHLHPTTRLLDCKTLLSMPMVVDCDHKTVPLHHFAQKFFFSKKKTLRNTGCGANFFRSYCRLGSAHKLTTAYLLRCVVSRKRKTSLKELR